MNHSSLTQLAQDVFNSGLGVAIPLPPGEKKEPPSGTTGSAPKQQAEEALKNLDYADDNCNVALRVNDTVIGIDVDHFPEKNKFGAESLAELEEEYGALPATFYNTRHGANAESRHMYFRVPAGMKWKGKAAEDIDILQFSNRYSVVAPSTFESTNYKWFNADHEELDTLPHVEDLPDLPSAWVEFLKKGSLADYAKYAPKKSFGAEEAETWLETVATNYEAAPNEGTKKKLAKFVAEIEDNAHDTTKDAVHWAVRFAVVEGAPGLETILATLKEAFVKARNSRPRNEKPEREWDRQFTGEVNDLRGSIEAGKIKPMVAFLSAANDTVTSLNGAKEAADTHDELIEAIRNLVKSYSTEFAAGEILALLTPGAKAITVAGKDSEIFDEEIRQELSDGKIQSIIKNRAEPALLWTYYPIPVEADEEEVNAIEADNARIGRVHTFLNSGRNSNVVRAKFAVALEDLKRVIRRDDIDAQPELLGLPDGRVVDLNLATAGCELMDVVRERKEGELLTRSLDVDPEKATAALAHRRKYYKGESQKPPAQVFLEVALPNPEVRKVAQKLLGYAAYGRMESRYRNLPVFMGRTSSGKTVLSDLINSVAGNYAGQVGIEALSKPDDAPNAELAAVIRSRWLLIPELSSANKAASARLKAVTSSEGVKATRKFDNNPIHSTTITPIIITNDAPDMRIDDAILKRLVVVPMNTDSKKLEKALPERARDGIFRKDVYGNDVDHDFPFDDENKAVFLEWLIQGFLLMRAEGNDQSIMPKEIQDAIAQFTEEADPVTAWLDTLDFSDPNAETTREKLAANFALEEAEAKFPSGAALKKLLAQRGVEYRRIRSGAAYIGVGLPKEERTKVPLEVVNS
ncbi:bifunctional DNA primase/polymerase [Corynebacterium casei]|uniref:bifunctional DNA primase/polymerase n=1 Tax=Corynebacterium casei TaxID=160386 RepID=UPI003FCF7200